MCPERSFCFGHPRCGAGVLCLDYPMASRVAVSRCSRMLLVYSQHLRSIRVVVASCPDFKHRCVLSPNCLYQHQSYYTVFVSQCRPAPVSLVTPTTDTEKSNAYVITTATKVLVCACVVLCPAKASFHTCATMTRARRKQGPGGSVVPRPFKLVDDTLARLHYCCYAYPWNLS